MRASILVLALSAAAVTGHKFKYEWCKLPAVQGPCKASFKRWYFNEERGECVQFQYGGCKGNKNRFKSASKCRLACGRELCDQEPPSGKCRLFMRLTRWYYSQSEDKCKTFTYRGCKDSANKFKSKASCERRCPSIGAPPAPTTTAPPAPATTGAPAPLGFCNRPQFCNDPMDEGICLAQIKRYYFDGTCCRKFYFGGVGGNLNNFKSKNACMRVCMPTASTNMWPVLVG